MTDYQSPAQRLAQLEKREDGDYETWLRVWPLIVLLVMAICLYAQAKTIDVLSERLFSAESEVQRHRVAQRQIQEDRKNYPALARLCKGA